MRVKLGVSIVQKISDRFRAKCYVKYIRYKASRFDIKQSQKERVKSFREKMIKLIFFRALWKHNDMKKKVEFYQQ